jgi:hypothetical protein
VNDLVTDSECIHCPHNPLLQLVPNAQKKTAVKQVVTVDHPTINKSPNEGSKILGIIVFILILVLFFFNVATVFLY